VPDYTYAMPSLNTMKFSCWTAELSACGLYRDSETSVAAGCRLLV